MFLAFVFAVILLVILNMMGVKNPPHRGARSGQLRARWQIKRMRKGKFW